MSKDASANPEKNQPLDLRAVVNNIESKLRESGADKVADLMAMLRNSLDDYIVMTAAGEQEIIRLREKNAALSERVSDLERERDSGRWS